MKLSIKDLEHLEALSRIKLPKDKEQEYLEKISHIVEYISHLSSANTKGVKPTSQVTSLENVLREDIVKGSLSQEDALKNSKHIYKGYFKLPKVVE